jgi:hypothetical protein
MCTFYFFVFLSTVAVTFAQIDSDTTIAMNLLTIPNQVFLLLVAEMALFMLLVIPMPFTVKRKMFTYVLDPVVPAYHFPRRTLELEIRWPLTSTF